MTELEIKYQKLATEFAKVRSQVNVLKKAVFDEQSNGEQLKNIIKEKEQSLRKYEQELDSLTFRNTQLSSRITMLQKELDEFNIVSNKKNKKVLSSSVSDFRVKAGAMDEELRLKIEENIILHRQVTAAEVEHQNAIAQLEEKLLKFENISEEHNKEINNLNKIHDQYIQQIMSEKILLEDKISKQDKENKESFKTINNMENKLQKLELESKILSDDSNNIPDIDRLMKVCMMLIPSGVEFVAWLNDLINNLDERSTLQTFNTDCQAIISASKLLKVAMKEYKSPFTNLSLKSSDFSITTSSTILEYLKSLLLLTNEYRSSIENVLNNQINVFKAESTNACFPSDLVHQNETVIFSFQIFLQNIVQINDLIQVNLLAYANNESIISFDNSITLFKTIIRSCEELQMNMINKIKMEEELPTTSIIINKINVEISSSIQKIIITLTKISSIIQDMKFDFSEDSCKDLLNNSFELNLYNSPNIKNLLPCELNEEPHRQFLQSEVDKLEKIIGDLKMEKEHWALDMHLFKLKYEKQLQKKKNNSEPYLDNDTIEELSSREKEILNYHKEIVHQKIVELQMADSKAIHFHAELVSIQKWLLLKDQNKMKVEEELLHCKKSISYLKDELVTTNRNYENQLSLMSEHLASLNETIVTQKDTIDSLNFQIQLMNKKILKH